MYFKIRDWTVVKNSRGTARLLVPFCEEGTPAAASNSFQPGEMEESSKSWLHAVQKIHPRDKHLLWNCESLLERYSEWHNKILEKIARWIHSNKSTDQCLAVDLPFLAFHNTDSVFKQAIRPDIILYDNSRITVLELTVCHRTNSNKSEKYKLSKYKDATNICKATSVTLQSKSSQQRFRSREWLPILFCDATNLPRLLKIRLRSCLETPLDGHVIFTNWEIILFFQIGFKLVNPFATSVSL